MLAESIKEHGQREPVLTLNGQVLDGWNRVRACRLINRKPWLLEFDPASAKMTPEQLVISANLRRRHLSVGQMSAIVVELSEQIEREGVRTKRHTRDALSPNSASTGGRPRAVLTAAAEMIGVDERRGREAKAVKEANPEVFTELKRGVITLHEAMVRTGLAKAESKASDAGVDRPEPAFVEVAQNGSERIPAEQRESAETDEPAAATPIATKPVAPRLTRKERLAGAWLEVEGIFGEKHAKWLRDGRLSDEEALEFEKLPTESDKKQVRATMLQGRSFSEAAATLTGLSPAHSIEDLHKRALKEGGRFEGQIGAFFHTVEYRGTA